MKRDMDLIRKILSNAEEADDLLTIKEDIPGYKKNIVDYHIKLLGEANLLHVEIYSTEGGTIKIHHIDGLTWQGHDFLDAARNEKVWNEAKKISKSKGVELPFKIFQSLLESIIKSLIMPN